MLDVTWIDAEIARLQKLREIATDPEMVRLVRLAEASKPVASTVVAETSRPNAGFSSPELFLQPTNGIAKRARRGSLSTAVREAALKRTEWFTGYELTAAMKNEGFQFHASKPDISVIDILRRMAEDKVLQVLVGIGNAPNQYRAPAKVEVAEVP